MRLDTIQKILATTLPSVDPSFRGDANETLAFARQLEHFFSKVYDVKYPDSMGRSLVPVDTSVPTGARSHTYRQFDDVGEASLITDYANDLPTVEAYGKEYTEKVVPIGNAFFISIQDLRSAAMLGIDIDTRKAEGARKIMERKLDALIAVGDSSVSMKGVANNASVNTVSGLTGSWSTATAAQIQADLEKIAKTVFDQSKGVYGNPDTGTALTLAVGTAQYSLLATKRLDTFNMTTVLEYVKSGKIPFISDIKPWSRLDLADAEGDGPRIIAMPQDPDVVSTIIPQDFEMLPMQPKALGYSVPCHMRWGGVVVRYPVGMVYADGC